MLSDLLTPTDKGLYCPAADIHIDPHKRVKRALITHGHADHARRGHGEVITSAPGQPIVQHRVGPKTPVTGVPFGETFEIGKARVSFHPAGHILGSAQIRLEIGGRVAVVTGDYKRGRDPTCEPFEAVSCDLLVTETTFGLPIYRWPDPAGEAEKIDVWWAENQTEGFNSLLLGYSLGKAQRLLAMLNRERGPILLHGAVLPFQKFYRQAGVDLPDAHHVNAERLRETRGRAMIVAPPSVVNTPWMRKLEPVRTAMASGWMLTRGQRRRAGYDKGFVISDHVDWPELVQTVADCRPKEVWAMHGQRGAVCRYFEERGFTTREV
ncbi:MAG: ligase-associated DNA damage response exonuclease [Verrucomicrobia bacterium]|nr:ligase-associated DNA damage response exonuclease [Verrucomicrobiota bacterium]MCH8528230.1 ligase-associated DNA damage response exonuclease [Kiritimatiellia bacterium]